MGMFAGLCVSYSCRHAEFCVAATDPIQVAESGFETDPQNSDLKELSQACLFPFVSWNSSIFARNPGFEHWPFQRLLTGDLQSWIVGWRVEGALGIGIRRYPTVSCTRQPWQPRITWSTSWVVEPRQRFQHQFLNVKSSHSLWVVLSNMAFTSLFSAFGNLHWC